MKKVLAILGLLSTLSTASAQEASQQSGVSNEKKVVCEARVNRQSHTSLHDLYKADESRLLVTEKHALIVSASQDDGMKVQISLYSLTSMLGFKRDKKLVAQSTGGIDLKLGVQVDKDTYFEATCWDKDQYKARILKFLCNEDGLSKYSHPMEALKCQQLSRIGLFK